MLWHYRTWHSTRVGRYLLRGGYGTERLSLPPFLHLFPYTPPRSATLSLLPHPSLLVGTGAVRVEAWADAAAQGWQRRAGAGAALAERQDPLQAHPPQPLPVSLRESARSRRKLARCLMRLKLIHRNI
eukprot:3266964-Rhodomonas_salina.4